MALIPEFRAGSFMEDFNRQRALGDARDAYANQQRDVRKVQAGTAGNFKTLPPGWDDFFEAGERAKDYASFDAGKPLGLSYGGDFGASDSGRSSGGYGGGAPRRAPSMNALEQLGSGARSSSLQDVIGEDLAGRNLEGSVMELRKLGLIPQFDQGTEDAEMDARKFGARRATMTPGDLAGEADSIDATYGPRRAMRQAQTALDVEPYNQSILDERSRGEGARYWSPMSQGVMADQDRRAINRSVAPAEAQAEGAFRRSQEEARGRIGAAEATAAGRRPDPMQAISTILGNMTAKGAFGVDRNGRPAGPPPDVQQKVSEILMQFLQNQQGGGAPGGPSGGPQAGGGNQQPAPGTESVINGVPAVWGSLDGGRTYGWIRK